MKGIGSGLILANFSKLFKQACPIKQSEFHIIYTVAKICLVFFFPIQFWQTGKLTISDKDLKPEV